jgi:ferredoxin
MIAPDSFVLDDIEGHSSAISEDVPPEQDSHVREAAQSCPEQAIEIRDDRQRGAAGRSGSPQEHPETTS